MQRAPSLGSASAQITGPRPILQRALKDGGSLAWVQELRATLANWTETKDLSSQWLSIAQGVEDKAVLAQKQAAIPDAANFFSQTLENRKSQAKALNLRPYEVTNWMRVASWAPDETPDTPRYLLAYSVRASDVQLEDIVKRPGDVTPGDPGVHDDLLKAARAFGRGSVTLLADQEWLLKVYGRYGYLPDDLQTESKKRMTKTLLTGEKSW